MKIIKLSKYERIVAVIPETVNGVGFRNKPLWIHIVDYVNNTHREECIQPEKQSTEMRLLFPILEASHNAMLSYVKTSTSREKKQQ